MYIGRFVILGKTEQRQWFLGYRVSSRSFPNRRIRTQKDRAVVLPTEDAPPSDNPYTSYNCLRTHADVTVVGNGSHVDPIIDKVSIGFGLRDAMALSLLALDYEHDAYNTPRIVAGLEASRHAGFLGIVGDDRLSVLKMDVEPGHAYLVATYELREPTPIALTGHTAEALCEEILRCEYEHPVTALAAVVDEKAGRQVVSSSVR